MKVPDEELFDVGMYIDRVEELDVKQLALDKPMSTKTFGQVREVNHAHVRELVDSYRRNPPVQLELTVYQDPGVYIVFLVFVLSKPSSSQ